jgi:uncharacterized protein (DUF427 family)
LAIAEEKECETVDGNNYFPISSIKKEFFTDSQTTTVCGWKGTANYFNVIVSGKVNKDCCWYYAEPKPAAKEIKGFCAFWKGVKIENC